MDHREIGEGVKSEPYILDLSLENKGRFLPAHIRVDGQFLASDKWAEMIKKTQETEREHAIIVSQHKGELLTSKIFEGFEHDVPIPAAPHGFKKFFTKPEGIAMIHTHGESNPNKNPSFSPADIKYYMHGNYHAMVMINKDGIHMLTGRNLYFDPTKINTAEIVAHALTIDGENTDDAQKVAELAASLSQFGIKYYFTPDLHPSADGFVNFTAIK